MEKKIIPIFFAIDDGYIPFFGVALQSLIENSSKDWYFAKKRRKYYDYYATTSTAEDHIR